MGSADFGRSDICSRSGGLISAKLQTGTPDFLKPGVWSFPEG